ncbi:MAG: hypothetical protein QW757_02245 [Candidatus Woesearchaeota archaeon]
MFIQATDLTSTPNFELIWGMMAAMFFFIIILYLFIYVYFSLTLMKTAQKMNMQNSWLAWIPIANFYLILKMANLSPMFLLLVIGFIIPFLNFIFIIGFAILMIIAQYKICEARQKPGWWALLQLIPIIGFIWSFVMWGILAFEKTEEKKN